MVESKQLVAHINELLEIERYSDYCPNGLQVEGKAEIKKLVTSVSASQSLIDQAVALKADAILVHHGWFWRGERAVITGWKKQRLQPLLQHNINLLAYHLPLDGHVLYGNNVQLAKQLGITVEESISIDNIPNLLWIGTLTQEMTAAAFAHHLQQKLQHPPLHITVKKPLVKRIAWCTGAAHRYIEQAAELKVDAYITGEISEPAVHLARELSIELYAAGHHATERYGVQALGQYLSDTFALSHTYIELDNPV